MKARNVIILSIVILIAGIGITISSLQNHSEIEYVDVIVPTGETQELSVDVSPLGLKDLSLDDTVDTMGLQETDDESEHDVECMPHSDIRALPSAIVTLEILVNGMKETVPRNIGKTNDCTYAVNTRGDTNEIWIEIEPSVRIYTLGDFYAVWEKQTLRSGLGLTVSVDGEAVYGGSRYASDNVIKHPEDIDLRDGMTITLEYLRKG